MRSQNGFTLIELITVIVILGALAVIALPRYIDLQDEAERAATEGVAGSLAAASAVNLSAALAGDTASTTVTDCTQVGGLLAGGLPADYTIASNALTANEGSDCVVTNNRPTTPIDVTFTGYGANGV